MSDVDPTPDTPITIGDRLGWWRGDVAARFTTLEAQVAALAGTPEASFATIKTELDDLQAQITDLRGSGMSNTLADLGVDIRAVRSGLTTELELIRGNQATLENRLDRIQAALGAEPYESLELASVRGLLQALLTNASAGTYGLAPITKPDDTRSDGDAYIDGRLYALFGDAPSTSITVSTNGYTLTGNWIGWNAYIQSADPSPLENNDLAPVNRWYSLSGTGSKHWSVQQKYTIRVFLRPPATLGYFDFVSVMATGTGMSLVPRPVVDWTNLPGYQSINTVGFGTWNVNIYLLGNFKNAVVSCNSTSPNFFRVALFTGSGVSQVTVNQGGIYTIPGDTTSIAIDNHSVRETGFTGRIQFA